MFGTLDVPVADFDSERVELVFSVFELNNQGLYFLIESLVFDFQSSLDCVALIVVILLHYDVEPIDFLLE
jgi:hypothetical protein